MLLTTLLRSQGASVQIAWAEFQVPTGVLTANQSVQDPTQSATVDHQSVGSSVQVSWAQYQFPGGATLLNLSGNQNVPSIGQVATADHATKSVQIAWTELQVPDTALAGLNLSANQTVPAIGQVATMYDPIATIDGGGTITETLPWRVVSGAQVVPDMAQSATMGTAPNVGLLSANQVMPAISQAGAMDASRTLSASQVMPDATQTGAVTSRLPAGSDDKLVLWGKKQAPKVKEVKDVRAEMERLAKQAEQQAQQAAAQQAKAKEAARLQAIADAKAKEAADRQKLADQLRMLTEQVATMQAKHQADLAQTAEQMQQQINYAAAVAGNALAKAKQLQDDNEAILALL